MPDPDPQRACYAKHRYSDERIAKQAALSCWYERRVWLRAYFCSGCAGWHLTRRDAAPVMQPGWRMPRKSQRQIAQERRQRARRRR